MPTLLPPTVGERLCQCGTKVEVWGITPGAEVILEVGAASQTLLVNSTATTFAVAPLGPGAKVRAKQRIAPDESLWSAVVTVELVSLPPTAPATEPSVARCSQSIFAWGVAPGSTVAVMQGTNVVGAQGIADRTGAACLPVLQPAPASYWTETTTCGALSPDKGFIQVDSPPPEIPPPKITQPLFECQSVVHFEQLVPGAVYEIFVRDQGGVDSSLGTFGACTANVFVNVPRQFKPGDRVRAIGAMERDRWQCHVRGRTSEEIPAEPPDDRIKPVIDEPVWEGDSTILVTNQIEGGSITLMRKDDVFDPGEELLGSRPSSRNPEVSPGVPLVKDNILWAVQDLCNVSRASDPVIVQGLPPEIPRPRVRKSVFACAEIAIVDNMIPGAIAWIFQVPIGLTGPEVLLGQQKSHGTSAVVGLFPRPSTGHEVFAKQSVGGKFSDPSGRLEVEFREDIPPPVIIEPVRPGDSAVWCEALIVGAHVRILNTVMEGPLSARVQIGAGPATSTQAAIPLWIPVPDGAVVSASQALCREGRPSADVPADGRSPCEGPRPYDPGKWNDGGIHQASNNCYNYACDVQSDTFAQPGVGGTLQSDCQCSVIAPRAISDGLDPCVGGSCHPCHHKVALVMAPGVDYHWYRLDDNGMWSHKPGDSPATNVDNSENPISNPETADRGPYTVFCGYFCVYKPNVSIS